MTTYDEIWECFLENCGYNSSDIPKSNERRYSMICNAVKYYNNKMEKYEDSFQVGLICNNTTETINKKLDDNEMLILANILKLIFLKNKQTEFTSTWSVFSKEMGLNNYRDQVKSKEEIVNKQEEEIDDLITNVLEEWEI